MSGRQESIQGQFGAQKASGPVWQVYRISEEEEMKGKGLTLGRPTYTQEDFFQTMVSRFPGEWTTTISFLL